MTQRIIIIGGGFSGICLAMTLHRTSNKPLEITIIEKHDHIAQGLAYSTINPDHLLNLPAVGMSLFEDNPNDFVEWLEKGESLQWEYFPRKLYSDYLKARFEKVLSVTTPVNIRVIHDEAIAIEEALQGNIITLASGNKIAGDKIVLAIGNLPPKPQWSEELNRSEHLIDNPWNDDIIPSLNDKDQVCILGSGLTMIDTVLSLVGKLKFKGKIIALSRHGLLANAHDFNHVDPPYPLSKASLPRTLRGMLRFLRDEAKTHIARGGNWRHVVDSLSLIIKPIWQSWTLAEQHAFIEHVRPYWDIHRHRLSPQVFDKIYKLREKKQLVIVAGRLQDVSVATDKVNVLYHDRQSKQAETINAACLINCTGPNPDYINSTPLCKNLHQQGFLCPNALKIGLALAENGALINKRNQPSQSLFCLGQPCVSLNWESKSVPAIRSQCMELAKTLLL